MNFDSLISLVSLRLHGKVSILLTNLTGCKTSTFYVSLFKTCDPRVVPCLAPGHTLSKLGRGLLDDLQTKYQSSRLSGFRKKIYAFFPNISLCKTCDPWVVPILAQGK